MRFSPLSDRLARDDTQAWNVHRLATERRARGDDIIMLTIGDRDFECATRFGIHPPRRLIEQKHGGVANSH